MTILQEVQYRKYRASTAAKAAVVMSISCA